MVDTVTETALRPLAVVVVGFINELELSLKWYRDFYQTIMLPSNQNHLSQEMRRLITMIRQQFMQENGNGHT